MLSLKRPYLRERLLYELEFGAVQHCEYYIHVEHAETYVNNFDRRRINNDLALKSLSI